MYFKSPEYHDEKIAALNATNYSIFHRVALNEIKMLQHSDMSVLNFTQIFIAYYGAGQLMHTAIIIYAHSPWPAGW